MIKQDYKKLYKAQLLNEYANNLILEIELDNINSEYGTKEHYCLFCKSNKYNGKVGIIHKEDCLILRLREQIKRYEAKEK